MQIIWQIQKIPDVNKNTDGSPPPQKNLVSAFIINVHDKYNKVDPDSRLTFQLTILGKN